MRKSVVIGAVVALSNFSIAVAAPITGSFSIQGFGGSYLSAATDTNGIVTTGAATAQTTNALDFGNASGGTGNGYGVNGNGTVGNANGAFTSFAGQTATIADIAITGTPAETGNTANPYASNAFITFGSGAGAIQLSFNNAAVTRSGTGTSITIAGGATFTDGTAADATTGLFSITADSQGGSPGSTNFTFTGDASASSSVPEPISMVLLGTGLVGLSGFRLRRR